MSATGPGRIGQVGLEVDVRRSWNVSTSELVGPGRTTELPTDIQHGDGPEHLLELTRRDQ
jgi:hypothetical protein